MPKRRQKRVKGPHLHECTGVEHNQARNIVSSVFSKLKRHGGRVVIVGAAGRSRAVGQRAIEHERLLAIDVGHGDQALVQGGIASVTDQVLEVRLVVVLVAAADLVLLAQAGDWEARIGSVGESVVPQGFVVEAIRVVEVVGVYAV